MDRHQLDDKLQLAILYFRSGDYDKALRLYNDLYTNFTKLPMDIVRTIRTNEYNLNSKPLVGPTIHPRLGSIIDQRAATYEKLGQHEMALKDGQMLILLEPISCKGYLRTGKLLLYFGKHVDAYKNFQRGLYIIDLAKKDHGISVPEKLYQNLKSQYLELNRQLKQTREKSLQGKAPIKRISTAPILPQKRQSISQLRTSTSQSSQSSQSSSSRSPSYHSSSFQSSSFSQRGPKPRDPFIILPLEIIEVIFQGLTFKNILSCHLVSKTWYQSLTRIPSLYTSRINFKSQVSLTEFTHGVKLIKKITQNSYSKQLKTFKVRAALNASHLHKILEIIISEPGFLLLSLDVMDSNLSFQLFLNKLCKFNWRLNNLGSIEHFRCGINSSVRYHDLIFKIFKHLCSLSVVVIKPDMSGPYNDMIPVMDKRFRKLQSESSEIMPYETLQTLTLVNHPMLNKDLAGVRVSDSTFQPYPIFMDHDFPNLKELTLVSFDFENRMPSLGEFLLKTSKLAVLTLENNHNLHLVDFLQLLKNYNPQFKLEKLVLREKFGTSATNLNQFTSSDLAQLNELKYLDISGCSLSIQGLLKLLKITNKTNQLTTLMLGNSKYLKFKTDSFQNPSVVSLTDLIRCIPNLRCLYLNELELDNQTMKHFQQSIKTIGSCKLQLLDISFCNKVEGIGLIDLFSAYPSNIKRMRKEGSEDQAFHLDKLIIDGIEINPSTLDMLKKYKFVKTIQNDVYKKRWLQFGVNSFVIP